MIPIRIVAVGRLKGDFLALAPLIDEYCKRLRPYARVEMLEVPDEPALDSRPAEQVLAREAERLRPYLDKAAYVAVLSEHGERLTSEGFARALERRVLQGVYGGGGGGQYPPNGGTVPGGAGPMIVVIGGALGVSASLIDRADWVLSLSPMTFPHLMVRLVLVEQLYRAFRILRNEPYHK